MPKLKRKNIHQKQASDRYSKRQRREDPVNRTEEQSVNTEARRNTRRDPARRAAEQSADTDARRSARRDPARRAAEQSADTDARRGTRRDPARRAAEQSADTDARKVSRLDPIRRAAEQSANTEAHKTTRRDPVRRQSEQLNQQRARKSKEPDYASLLQTYRKTIKFAPSFICSCCGGLWYEKSTTPTTAEKLKERGATDEFIETVLNVHQDRHRLCSTCKISVHKNKVPRLCLKNGFDFPSIPDELKDLSPLEERLVSLRLPFMQIRLVGSERQSVLRGNVVNVENDLSVCASVLPRSFDDSSTIQVQLMRRMTYQIPYMYETIRPLKVYQAAKYLINSEVYQSENVVLSEEWSRYQEGETLNFICSQSNGPSANPAEEQNDTGNDEEDTLLEETEYPEELPNLIPDETLIFSEKETGRKYTGVRIAPAEGNTPIALHRDANADVMTFPSIYCGQQRNFKEGLKITYTDIAKSELRRYDRRACLPAKILHSFKRSFNEKVIQAIQICLRKTNQNEQLTASTILKIDSVRNLLESDDGYAVFKHLRSSPSYWKQQTKKVLGMIRQIGKATLFITLSAAETKWTELLFMLYKIQRNEDISEEDIAKLPFDQVAELNRSDPVTCMRNFEHRFRQLRNLILKPENGLFAPYQLADHYNRGEFQMRGSPHEHGLYWIKGAPEFIEDDEESVRMCVEFIDHFITCERSEDGEMEKFIGYQIHKHSHTCKKRSKKCRFGFPKPPLDSTLILSPLPKEYDPELRKEAKELFSKITVALDGYGRGFQENVPFDVFLESLDTTYLKYIEALRSSIKRNTVFLKRQTSGIFVNQYNRKLLEAWGANIDVQFILDTYACAKYCVGYILKGEAGVSRLLHVLTQDVKKGNISARDQVKKFAGLLINGTEISAQEASAFLLGIPNTSASRQDVFINTAPPHERTSILKSNAELETLPDDSQDIICKGLIEHYAARPEELQNICLAEFASMFQYSKKATGKEENELEDEEFALTQENAVQKDSKHFKLTDGSGYVRKRKVAKIIRYRHYSKKEDLTNYCREQLMLYWPWNDEEQDLLNSNVVEMATKYQNVILDNSKNFIHNRNVDENILRGLVQELEEAEDASYENEPLIDEDLENFGADQFALPEFHGVVGVGPRVEQFLPPKLVGEAQYLRIMRSLNEKQRRFVLNKIFLLKTSNSPFYHFLSGGAGVGKSHVITAIVQSYLRYFSKIPNTNPDQVCVLVSAPTGKAAFNVFGMTLHCTFKLPPTQYGGRVCNLEDGAVNSLRQKLEKTKIFIIDEISMVSVKQLYDIDQRLRQIFCTEEEFGGKSVLVVGHLRQLPPIGGSYVFKDPKHLPLGELVGNHLWQKFQLYELDEIMRQKGDFEFCKALNNMSEGTMDADDIALIRSRETNDMNNLPMEAIHLFQTNDECGIFNLEIHSELGSEGITSTAYDKIQGVGSEAQKLTLKEYAKTMDRQQTDGLPYETHLQVGAEYFISTNVDVPDGLFNGSTGRLMQIDYGLTPANVRVPICAWMDFRNPLIGFQKRQKTKSYQQQKGINLNWVPVHRMTRNLSKTQRHGGLEIVRTQIPLVAANGMTVAKSQGSSMPTVAVHMKKYQGKSGVGSGKKGRERKMTRETLYVGCSRATSLRGLYIVGEFVPPERPGPNDPVTLEMARLRSIPFQFSLNFMQDYDDGFEKLYFHNVQSFVAHHPDVQADHTCMSSNFIALVEPHLLDRDTVALPEFDCRHRSNCRGQQRNSEGALLFQKSSNNPAIVSNIVQNYTATGHCIFLTFVVSDMTAVMTYKSPSFPRSVFVGHLEETIKKINGNVILFGDFNIDLWKADGNALKEVLQRLGLVFILPSNVPSTDHGTQIDGCFSNCDNVEAWFYESYYSYHKPICMVWPKQ